MQELDKVNVKGNEYVSLSTDEDDNYVVQWKDTGWFGNTKKVTKNSLKEAKEVFDYWVEKYSK